MRENDLILSWSVRIFFFEKSNKAEIKLEELGTFYSTFLSEVCLLHAVRTYNIRVYARPWVWAQWLRSNKRPPFLFLELAESSTAKFCSVVMAHTVISVKLPPNIDPTKSRLAYGDRALPKLVSMIICISKYLRSKVRSRLSWMLSVYRTESIPFTSYMRVTIWAHW